MAEYLKQDVMTVSERSSFLHGLTDERSVDALRTHAREYTQVFVSRERFIVVWGHEVRYDRPQNGVS